MMGNGIPLSCAAICQKWIDQSFLTTGSKNPLALDMGECQKYKYQHMLKPCPLCGGMARLTVSIMDDQKWMLDQNNQLPLWYGAYCTKCHFRINYLPSMEDVVGHWNKRANEE